MIDTGDVRRLLDNKETVELGRGVIYLDAPLTLRSRQRLIGQGRETVFVITQKGVTALSCDDIDNVRISNLTITSSPDDSGKIPPGTRGIWIDGGRDIDIENVRIFRLGHHDSSPRVRRHSNSGAFGIGISARKTFTTRCRISQCDISDIAGDGFGDGDGIYVSGYGKCNSRTTSQVTVTSCTISGVGRHGLTVTGGEGRSFPRDVTFLNCRVSDTALAGLDIEGSRGLVDVAMCRFERCGTFSNFYSPGDIYGSEYRLRAAIALSNDDECVRIARCQAISCAHGITLGATKQLQLLDTTIRGSMNGDLVLKLAQSPSELRISGVHALSPIGPFRLTHRAKRDGAVFIENSEFTGGVILGRQADMSVNNTTGIEVK